MEEIGFDPNAWLRARRQDDPVSPVLSALLIRLTPSRPRPDRSKGDLLMPLFVVEHQHPAETCPAGDPQIAPMLLQHLSKANASQYGVEIHGEGVVNGAHRLFLILAAEDKDRVREFMAPFAMAGTVEVLEASPCEAVVARAAC
jgi:hypothetical protein